MATPIGAKATPPQLSLVEPKEQLQGLMDKEISMDLSVAEIMVIVASIDIMISAYEEMGHVISVSSLRVSTMLIVLWTLEQRLQDQLMEVIHEHNK